MTTKKKRPYYEILKERRAALKALSVPDIEFPEKYKGLSPKDAVTNLHERVARYGAGDPRKYLEKLIKRRKRLREKRLEDLKEEPLQYTVWKNPPCMMLYAAGDEDIPECYVFSRWKLAQRFYRNRLKEELAIATPHYTPGKFFTIKNGSNGNDYIN